MLWVRPISVELIRFDIAAFKLSQDCLAFLVSGHFVTAVMGKKNHLHRELTDIVFRLKIELRLSRRRRKESLLRVQKQVCSNYSEHLTEILISTTTIVPILWWCCYLLKFCFGFIMRHPQIILWITIQWTSRLSVIQSVVKEWNKKVRSEAETSQLEKSHQKSATFQHICNVSIQTYQCNNVSVTEQSKC